mmetsp:Transcript_12155/g.38707  ORF Transcript_12155/g.38707 Transcript_12155/m.38707 type:complete len:441 (-) Transcript_12155:544-1866(-)
MHARPARPAGRRRCVEREQSVGAGVVEPRRCGEAARQRKAAREAPSDGGAAEHGGSATACRLCVPWREAREEVREGGGGAHVEERRRVEDEAELLVRQQRVERDEAQSDADELARARHERQGGERERVGERECARQRRIEIPPGGRCAVVRAHVADRVCVQHLPLRPERAAPQERVEQQSGQQRGGARADACGGDGGERELPPRGDEEGERREQQQQVEAEDDGADRQGGESDLEPPLEPRRGGERRGEDAKRVWQRARAVKERVELHQRQREEGEPALPTEAARHSPVDPRRRGGGCEPESDADGDLRVQLRRFGELQREHGRRRGGGEQERADECARHDAREGVVVVLGDVGAVEEEVVDGLEVEALLDLCEGANKHVRRDEQHQRHLRRGEAAKRARDCLDAAREEQCHASPAASPAARPVRWGGAAGSGRGLRVRV